MKRLLWLAFLMPTFAIADSDSETYLTCQADPNNDDCVHVLESDVRIGGLEDRVTTLESTAGGGGGEVLKVVKSTLSNGQIRYHVLRNIRNFRASYNATAQTCRIDIRALGGGSETLITYQNILTFEACHQGNLLDVINSLGFTTFPVTFGP